MLSPSLRNIPFTGIEWSYQMKDLGFNEKGELHENRRDEESKLNKQEENKEIEETEMTVVQPKKYKKHNK